MDVPWEGSGKISWKSIPLVEEWGKKAFGGWGGRTQASRGKVVLLELGVGRRH